MYWMSFHFGYEDTGSDGITITHPNIITIEDKGSGHVHSFDFDELRWQDRQNKKRSRYSAPLPLFLLNHLLYFCCVEKYNGVDEDLIVGWGEGISRAREDLNREVAREFPEMCLRINPDMTFSDPLWVEENIRWDTNLFDPAENMAWYTPRLSVFRDIDIFQYEDPNSVQTIDWEIDAISNYPWSETGEVDPQLLPHIRPDDQDLNYSSLFEFVEAHEASYKTRDTRLILIDGSAGSGKTYSLYDTRDRLNSGTDEILAFYAELKDLVRSHLTLLPWLLSFTSAKDSRNPRRALERLCANTSRILFIIDSFDEISPEFIATYINDIKWLLSNQKVSNVRIILGTRSADVFLRSSINAGTDFSSLGYRHVRTLNYSYRHFDDPEIRDFIRRFPDGGTPLLVKMYKEICSMSDTPSSFDIRSEYDLLRIRNELQQKKAAMGAADGQDTHPVIYEQILPRLAYAAYMNENSAEIGSVEKRAVVDILRYDWHEYMDILPDYDEDDLIGILMNTGEFRSKPDSLVFSHFTILQYYAAVYAASVVSCSFNDDSNAIEDIRKVCDSVGFYQDTAESFDIYNDRPNDLSPEALKNMFFVHCLFREMMRIRVRASQYERKLLDSRFDLLKPGLDLCAWDMYSVFDELSDPDHGLLMRIAAVCNRYSNHVTSRNITDPVERPDAMRLRLVNAALFYSIGRMRRTRNIAGLDRIESCYQSITGCVLRNLYDAFDSRSFNRNKAVRDKRDYYFAHYGELIRLTGSYEGIDGSINPFDDRNITFDFPEDSIFCWQKPLYQRELMYLLKGLCHIIYDRNTYMTWLRRQQSDNGYHPALAAQLISNFGAVHLVRSNLLSAEDPSSGEHHREVRRAQRHHDYAHGYRVHMSRASEKPDPRVILSYIELATDMYYTALYLERDPELPDPRKVFANYELAVMVYYEEAMKYLGYDLSKIEKWDSYKMPLIETDWAPSSQDFKGHGRNKKSYLHFEPPVGAEPYVITHRVAGCYYRYLHFYERTPGLSDSTYIYRLLTMRMINATYCFLINACTDKQKDNQSMDISADILCRERLEQHRRVICSLWDDVRNDYITCLGKLIEKDREEALHVLNKVLWLYQQVSIDSEGIKIVDTGTEFRVID